MKNKKQYIQNTEDENRDNTEAGEDNEENSSSSFNIFTDEADRCPICLNCLAEQEVGFPENCTHIFCVTCILKWAETRASCPVDRKQFQAVYKLSVVKDFIKVQIKQQVSKKDDLLSCNEGKYCPMNMKSFTRKQENEVRKPLTAIFWKGWNQKCGSSDNEDKNAALMKKNKPRRQTCSNRFFRSNSCNRSFSSSSSTGESPNHRNECIEISKIDTSVERKRRELELSGSVLARAERIPSMCYEMETFLRVPTVAVGALFPIDTTPLENFGSSVKGYAVTYVQEGEEKKQTSGTAGTRGTRRKISDNTPRRRSARNTKTETASQSQTSPKSSSSGCEASGDGSSFVNASCAESEKLPPKRKAKRAVKQQEPLVKKKLRSYGRCRKPPGDLVEEGDSETEATVLLDKGHLPDTEKSTSDFSQKSDVELQSVNGLENSTDLVKCKELPEDSCKGLDTSEMLDMDPCVQEPPVLTPERETEKCDVAEDTEFQSERHYISAAELIDQPPHLSGEELSEDTVTLPHLIRELDNSETELPGKVELVAIADKPLDSSGDRLALGAESVAVVDEPLPNPENELQEVLKCVESEKQLMSGPENELLGRSESVAVTDEVLDSTGNEKPEEPLAGHCSHSGSSLPEESVVGEDQPLGSPRSKLLELQVSLEMEAPETEEKEASTLGDNEDQKYTDLLMNIASGNKCDQSLEEVREASRMSVSPTTHAEDVKHFSEDNNDIVAMECDSFSSDQNDTHIDQPVESGIVEQEADSLLHEMEHSVSFTSLEKREESECSGELKKEKKPRTRRSRFHSPSTTWSPSMREGRKSQSPSPERTTVAEGRMSRSPRKEIVTEGRVSQSPKGDISKEGQRSLSQSPKRDLLTKRKKSLSQSPKRDQMREGRSLSQSPRREPQREGRSRSQSPKKDLLRGERRSLSQSPKRDLLREGRRSPSCSPKRDGSREKRRSSRTRAKDSSPRHKCRSQSRDRDSDKEGPRRDHGRERGRRRWSQSRSRSRSRSRQRNKGPSFPRNERESYSPPRWKERWTNDNWRSPRGNDRYKRNEQDKLPENLKRERDSTDKDSDTPLDPDQYKKDYPDWVMERINSVPESKNREREKFKGPAWEENRQNNSGPPWNRNFGSSWNSNRGRGGRNRGGRGRGGFLYGDQSENRWQPWKPHSGNTNSTGNESSRYPEHQPYKRKSEQDFSFDTPADRSGWTSASSWAVRKTLPADVQNYYSRRGRTSPSPQSAWTRPEEAAAPEQDPNFKDQTSQQGDNSQLPINIMQPQMNVMTPVNTQHQPMNIFPYPMGVHAPMMNIQHNPFNLPPPVPMHLHTGVPLVQVATPTNMSQGPPPPPPPPPPSQQVNYVASQLDGKQLQAIPSTSHGLNNMGTPIPPASTAALGSMEAVQGPSSGNTTSSSTIKSSNSAVKLAESKVSVTVEASADSSKKDQKLLIQEKAAQEVKLAIKPFYQNKDISKEEYKEIVRKAVDKVCHSKSGEVNSAKVANLVKAYVDKYKHSRKKNPEEAISMERK